MAPCRVLLVPVALCLALCSAAAGPLATGAGLAFIAPEMMHMFVSAAFVIAFCVFVMSPGWRAVTRVG